MHHLELISDIAMYKQHLAVRYLITFMLEKGDSY